jgi:hypothetical protein
MPVFGKSNNCSFSVDCMFTKSAERADRQPRIALGPAPIVDLPVFSPHMNMSAQAAALVAAAASGTPF